MDASCERARAPLQATRPPPGHIAGMEEREYLPMAVILLSHLLESPNSHHDYCLVYLSVPIVITETSSVLDKLTRTVVPKPGDLYQRYR